MTPDKKWFKAQQRTEIRQLERADRLSMNQFNRDIERIEWLKSRVEREEERRKDADERIKELEQRLRWTNGHAKEAYEEARKLRKVVKDAVSGRTLEIAQSQIAELQRRLSEARGFIQHWKMRAETAEIRVEGMKKIGRVDVSKLEHDLAVARKAVRLLTEMWEEEKNGGTKTTG